MFSSLDVEHLENIHGMASTQLRKHTFFFFLVAALFLQNIDIKTEFLYHMKFFFLNGLERNGASATRTSSE